MEIPLETEADRSQCLIGLVDSTEEANKETSQVLELKFTSSIYDFREKICLDILSLV